MGRENEYWEWLWLLLGKKQRVLHTIIGPVTRTVGMLTWLVKGEPSGRLKMYASLVGFNLCRLKAPKGNELPGNGPRSALNLLQPVHL